MEKVFYSLDYTALSEIFQSGDPRRKEESAHGKRFLFNLYKNGTHDNDCFNPISAVSVFSFFSSRFSTSAGNVNPTDKNIGLINVSHKNKQHFLKKTEMCVCVQVCGRLETSPGGFTRPFAKPLSHIHTHIRTFQPFLLLTLDCPRDQLLINF